MRDIVYQGKRTHGEFLKSEEGIATNILADRLTRLECQGVISKEADPKDKRREIFALTDKGLALIPLLLDMNMWSDVYGPEFIGGRSGLLKAALEKDREGVIAAITEDVKKGGFIFAHEEWVPPHSRVPSV